MHGEVWMHRDDKVAARLEEASAPPREYPGSFIAWIQRGLDPTEK